MLLVVEISDKNWIDHLMCENKAMSTKLSLNKNNNYKINLILIKHFSLTFLYISVSI